MQPQVRLVIPTVSFQLFTKYCNLILNIAPIDLNVEKKLDANFKYEEDSQDEQSETDQSEFDRDCNPDTQQCTSTQTQGHNMYNTQSSNDETQFNKQRVDKNKNEMSKDQEVKQSEDIIDQKKSNLALLELPNISK